MKKFIVQQSSFHTKLDADSFEVTDSGVVFKGEDGKTIAFFAAVIFVITEDPKEES